MPQGSPLSPVLFLVWMAPILVEMERRIQEEVPGVGPSYLDNLHWGLNNEHASCRRLEEVELRELMENLIEWVSVVRKEVAVERGHPLAENKEERLILHVRGGRRGRRGVHEKVKWLWVILDEDLDLDRKSVV